MTQIETFATVLTVICALCGLTVVFLYVAYHDRLAVPDSDDQPDENQPGSFDNNQSDVESVSPSDHSVNS